jgi:hypothetical protein
MTYQEWLEKYTAMYFGIDEPEGLPENLEDTDIIFRNLENL